MVAVFYIVLSGSSLDRKLDFTSKNVMLPTGYFINKKGKLTRNPFIPECNEWFLDSGGFSLLSKWNDYPFSLDEYVKLIKRKEPDYAATMDYPCEPELNIVQSTSRHSRNLALTTRERIERSVENARAMIENYEFKHTKIIPVIQGWEVDDYRYCINLYHKYDLLSDYVAFGSMCRRTSLKRIRPLIIKLTDYLWHYTDAKTHFFGFKLSFLRDYAIQQRVYSADTSAWRFNFKIDGKKKRMYARSQYELKRNYYEYMSKLDKILTMYEAQVTIKAL